MSTGSDEGVVTVGSAAPVGRRVAVIVPCITVDALAQRCVAEVVRTCPGTPVVVLADHAGDPRPWSADVEVIETGPVTIAAKRNLGAKVTDAELLAFIDSDAWPADGWLDAVCRAFDADPGLGAVGGPNVSPPTEARGERYVGIAHRSFLVDGWWTYRKDRHASARDVPALPSCNLVVRRTDYEALDGMSEALFTAEDTDFCARLVAAGRRIRFTPDALVFHKDRGLRSFVVQRFTFGVAMVPLLRIGRRPDPAYTAVSMVLGGFTLFALAGPVLARWRRTRRAWALVMGAYGGVAVAEAVRHSPRVQDVPGATATLVVGNLAPGVGLLARAVGLARDLQGHYRNDDARLLPASPRSRP